MGISTILPWAFPVIGPYVFVTPNGARRILVFDTAGSYLRDLAPSGQGPRELLRPLQVFPIAPDSLGVLDVGNLRVAVLDSSLSIARTVRLPGPTGQVVPLTSGLVVATGLYDQDAAGIIQPLHVLNLSGSHASVIRSFGGSSDRSLERDRLLLALDPTSMWVWAARGNQYLFEHWDTNGSLDASFAPDRDWLGNIAGRGQGTPDYPPSSFVVAVSTDEEARLWVFTLIPDMNWKEAWSGVHLTPGVELDRRTRPPRQKLFDTMVEVFLPNGESIAQRRLDEVVVSASASHLATTRLDPSGVPIAELWRFILTPSEGG